MRTAAPVSPRSRRAPDSTIRISIWPASSRSATWGSRASAKRPLGSPERSLAVGHHRQVHRVPAHPASGLELCQRFFEATGRISRLAARLADDGNPRRAGSGGQSVLIGGLGIAVEQSRSGDEVARDSRGKLLRQRLQLVGDDLVEFVAGDVVRYRRTVVLGLNRGSLVRRQFVAAPLAGRASASGPCCGRVTWRSR